MPKPSKKKKLLPERAKTCDPEMRKTIIRGLQSTWQTIGYDYITANGGKDVDADDVREAVPDYFEMYGKEGKEAENIWNILDFDFRDEILKEAFPMTRYGL